MRADVEIMDMAETVAAQRQAIEQRADAVFAEIEGVAAERARGWIAVGHDHFGERGAVHDGAQTALVLIADVVEDQAFADIEADAQAPFLPAHLVALDGEAWAFRLGYLQGLHVAAQTLREFDRAGIGRQWR